MNLGRHLSGHAFAADAQLGANSADRVLERKHLTVHVLDQSIRDRGEVGRRRRQDTVTDSNARRALDPSELGGQSGVLGFD